MACMQHDCADCGHRGFDNHSWKYCPMCGSKNVSNDFDEAPESFIDDDEGIDYEKLEE